MSRLATSFVLGYHGCNRQKGLEALQNKIELMKSEKDFDWLGPGIYFWEADPQRAQEWAIEQEKRLKYNDPFVIGAVIDLGHCLDLTLRENLEFLRVAYENLKQSGLPIPENTDPASAADNDKLFRYRDCAVIKHAHTLVRLGKKKGLEPFDTVRGLFIEGEPIYPGAGFNTKTHTQIAVCNPDCIKAIFQPR
jgi:hypothetical protein